MLSRFSTMPLKLKEAVINEEKGLDSSFISYFLPDLVEGM